MVLRLNAAIAVLLALLALTTACGGSDDGPSAVVIATTTPGTEQGGGGDGQLAGFVYPISGACLPAGDQLMPNAPRDYRDGVHEGVDFYDVDNCTAITLGTPVLAVKAGTVIRADHDYVELDSGSLNGVLANPTTEDSLDTFRGRQVWIDHGGGIVTRYAHLDSVAEGLQMGQNVEAGQVIATVGESGTPESVSSPGSEYHLHFEVRVDDSYFGAGEDAATVRTKYLELFGQQP